MKDRKEERILIKKDVLINDSIEALIFDISEGGMYIRVQAEFTPGSVLKLSFDVNDGPINVKALVRHTQPGVGVGVKFIGLSLEDAARIKMLLEKLRHVIPSGVSGKKKVIFIDDDVRSKSVYKTRLLQDGFTVIEVSNETEVLKLMRDSRPDIVIINPWTEGIDGFKLLKLIQTNPDVKTIPILILSARGVLSDVEKAIALGARDFLLKMATTPIRLSEKIREILGDT